MGKIGVTGLVLLLVLISPRVAPAAQLRLDWIDTSNESGFRILRKIPGLPPFRRVSTVGQNITSYTDTGLSPGTRYCYRVRAFNAAGKSARSNKACGVAQ
jgi:titin